MKNDVVVNAKQQLLSRLDDEQNKVLQMIKKLVGCVTAEAFISASSKLFEYCPVSDSESFVNSVIADWEKMKPPNVLLEKDYGSKLLHLIRNSSGLVQSFLASFIVVAPHSMAVECCVSTYNLCFF